MRESSAPQSGNRGQTLSSDLTAVHLGGCLSPKQIAASIAGERNQVDQDTIMAHLAACADCSALYKLLLGPKAKKPTLFSHGRWRWWLAAAAIIVAGPLLFLSGRDNGTSRVPPTQPVTAAPETVPPQATQTAQHAVPPQPLPSPQPPQTATKPFATPGAKTPAGQPTSTAPLSVSPPLPVATAKPMAAKAATPAVTPHTVPPVATPPKPQTERAPGRAPLQLMTDAEAALPASPLAGVAGITVDDGPTIVIDKPGDGTTVANGFPLYILYEAAGRHAIDLNSIKLVCRKQSNVNLTPRIKPYITEKGIWIENVHLPPGHYRLKLSLTDTMGRPAEREFSLNVISQPHS